MTRSTEPKKLTLRKLATFLAAIGMLIASSGIALMVAAAPANAATEVGVCHATSSDSNPYTFLSVDDDSVKFAGHLAHRQTPNKTWQNAGTFNGVPHAAGADKPDLIGDFTDDQGVFHAYDGVVTEATCQAAVVVLESVADVDFFGPTCAFPTRAEYETSGLNVAFSVQSGSATPGSSIVVRATSTNGATFDGGATFQDFAYDFDPALDPNAPPCAVVDPPDVKVDLCHATGSDNNPYEFISVNNDAVKLQGHLDHRQNPQMTWQNAGTFNGVPHAAGDPKPDLIGDFTDDQGDLQVYDGVITEALCNGAVTPADAPDATAEVIFVDPSCVNLSLAVFLPFGVNVDFAITDGLMLPGQDIEVTATAKPGHTFADLSTTKVFTHTFGPAVNLNGPPCVVVEPPGPDADATASVDFVDPSCDNLNDASYTTSGNEVTFAVTDGVVAPGSAVEVTATANAGHTFADLSTEQVFTHLFSPAADLAAEPCISVAPPVITPPAAIPTDLSGPGVAIPTVVHSGITEDLRSEQGLALLTTGMVLMVLAGGLGLVRPTGRARS